MMYSGASSIDETSSFGPLIINQATTVPLWMQLLHMHSAENQWTFRGWVKSLPELHVPRAGYIASHVRSASDVCPRLHTEQRVSLLADPPCIVPAVRRASPDSHALRAL